MFLFEKVQKDLHMYIIYMIYVYTWIRCKRWFTDISSEQRQHPTKAVELAKF